MARTYLQRTINSDQITQERIIDADTPVSAADIQPQTKVLTVSSSLATVKTITLPSLPYITDLTIRMEAGTLGSYTVSTLSGTVTLATTGAAVSLRSTGETSAAEWIVVGLSGGAFISSGSPISPMTTSVRLTTLVGTPVTFAPLPCTGKILRMTLSIQGALTVGNATVTAAIDGVAVTTGVFTIVQAASAAGDTYTLIPTGSNTISSVDQKLSFTVGGTNTAAVAADIVTVIG